MRDRIAVVVVCLVMGVASGVSAQESVPTLDESAPASVEMSLSIAPSALLSLASLNLGSAGGSGGLGGISVFQPTLDVGFAIDRSLLLVAGLSISASSSVGTDQLWAAVPLSLLWYLEPPRVGHVMPMLRVGVELAYSHYSASAEYESYGLGALARGGITWLADRCIGIRAELGVRGGARVDANADAVSGSVGLDALVGVVLRV